ncbi:thermonuclease family protein [Candidatus Shapirobacteria bacterium]|nr:thermonuclease family protein [Candidatus Shapirobacteria bacterium]
MIKRRGKSKQNILLFLAALLLFLASFFTEPEKNSEESPLPTPTPVGEKLPTPSASQEREKAKVARVIDGDTIELEDGRKVRYIGIDTPETVDPKKPVQCYGKEAYLENKSLVEGKEIEMEKDVSETDHYGRFLRYVWAKEVFINEYLVREGFAHAVTFPPDVKYQGLFLEAERKAREESKGFWSGVCQ